MLTINLFDSNFVGQDCSVALQTPKTMRYVRDRANWEGITFFTDAEMFKPTSLTVGGRKFGWLHEGRELHPENYLKVERYLDRFEAVFTTEPNLWRTGKKYWPVIRGGCWVAEAERGFTPKSQIVSMVTSTKNAITGHKLRHEIREQFPTQINYYGDYGIAIGYEKRLAYQHHAFAVIVEAQKSEGFFSEHLLDCMAFGTIPLYWGCPDIGKFFDPRGLLGFTDLNELDYLLKHLTPALYESMRPYAEENLKRINEYAITEDWIVKNLLEPAFGVNL